MDFPKKIWFYWQQGFDAMPEIVRRCYESWLEQNPDYDLVFLDRENFHTYVTIEEEILNNKNISVQSFSDILRISLLEKYGGVWVDATLLCTKPLNQWIDQHANSGFFAFEKPYEDRLLSNWFLASRPNSELVTIFRSQLVAYWKNNPDVRNLEQESWLKKKIVFAFKRLSFGQTSFWFTAFTRKILRVYPYLCFHYLFQAVYQENEQVRSIWDSTPKFSATVPHQLMDFGYERKLTPNIQHFIDANTAPLHKLSHKKKLPIDDASTAIGYLFANQNKK